MLILVTLKIPKENTKGNRNCTQHCTLVNKDFSLGIRVNNSDIYTHILELNN